MKQLSHVLIKNLLERCLSLTKTHLNKWKFFLLFYPKKKKIPSVKLP